MGNAFCVRGSDSFGCAGAAGPFVRVFGPNGFFMLGIPSR
jgi:hypothetical protein